MTSLLSTFVERGRLAGSLVHEPAADPAAGLCALLRDQRLSRIVLAGSVRECVPWLPDAVSAAGVQLRDATLRDDILWADAGLSVATLAIAETGSVIPHAATRLDRLVSMLPPTHIVFVPEATLVATLDDGAAYLRREARSARYLSFVTGPSRTGDIEMVLTVGVHGPSTLNLVVMRES